jgi:hypothetical protein
MKEEPQIIELYMGEPYLDSTHKKWTAYLSESKPAGKYFIVKIPLPEEYAKNRIAILEAEINQTK